MVKQEEIYRALDLVEKQGDFAFCFNDLSFILLQALYQLFIHKEDFKPMCYLF